MRVEFREVENESVAVFTDGSLMGVYDDAVLACHALADEFAYQLGVLRPDGSWGEA